MAAAALGCVWACVPAAARAASLAGPVSTTAAQGTPQLAPAGFTEQVRQLVQCGGTMYAVGRFTAIRHGGTVYRRDNIFSFSATSPFSVTSWNPGANGQVNSIAFNGSNCADAYIGGNFTSVHGTAAGHIAKISTSTGAVVPGFAHGADRQVETLAVHGGHVLTGGNFTSINGSSSKFFVSLNATTGRDDGYLRLNISGNYGSGATKVYNQQISHSGVLDLAEGTFTSVGGLPRQQIFMLSLGGSRATVTGWTSPEFSQRCVLKESFYVRAASWSPSDSTVFIGTTGFHPLNTGAHPGGLCDAAAAFPAAQTSVHHSWINYTGCDSLYSTAADGGAAYFGGHERWADNRDGCNVAGPGAVTAHGMVGLSPGTGSVVWNPTRSRGWGADDMLLTRAGLWIASDNFAGSQDCAHSPNHAGICFMPYLS
jgi:hypothetical protein